MLHVKLDIDRRSTQTTGTLLSALIDKEMAWFARPKANDDVMEIAKELYSSSDEHPTPVEAKISGKVPEWFAGTLLRVGPGKFEWGKSTYKHWFDGQALMHKFQVTNGRVLSSSQFLHSNSYDKSKKYGRVALPGFATWAPPDPCKSIFQRFFLYFLPPEMSDNCNVNFVGMKDGVYATTETPYVYEVDTDKLKAMVEDDLTTTLPGPRSLLAHPHQDEDGTVYNISTNILESRYDIIRIPPKAKSSDPFTGTTVVASVPFSFKSQAYFHSFGITEHYFILMENPLVIAQRWKLPFMNFLKLSYLDLMKWKPELKSRLHLIHRQSGEVIKTVYIDDFFAFHHANAYEESGNVIIDICGYPDATILDAFYLKNLRSGLKGMDYSTPLLRRYVLPTHKSMEASALGEHLPKLHDGRDFDVLCDGFEMPRLNYSFNGRKYKFLYGAVFADKNLFLTHLAKVNVDTKAVTNWSEEHCFPSEPIFIAAPNAADEDDGIVLSVIVGVLGKPSFLLFLDGKTFKEVARAIVPFRLAMTFHGRHL